MEENKKICGHCCAYDVFCGICLNPIGARFDEEDVYELEACEKYYPSEEYLFDE